MIERAVLGGGLKLTATGALSRADTKALFDEIEWPDYDKAKVLAFNKVLNEDDVLPVQLTRIVLQEAKLLRARKGRLLATKRARELLGLDRTAELYRDLFEASFWRINLAYFDRIPVN